ncbi:MAG: SdrD B-like domain-containing protein, partial [Pseudomonadota bacterium]
EDGDGSDPDDNAGGGTITFDFNTVAEIGDLTVIDIEEAGGTIVLYGLDDATVIDTIAIPANGDGSIASIMIDAGDVGRMDVNFVGSGAIDDICIKPDDGTNAQEASLGDLVFFDDDGDGIQDAGEAGVGGVTVTLTGGGADGIIGTADDTTDTTTTDADGLYASPGVSPVKA